MKPTNLIGEVFDMPVFHAVTQQYKVKDVVEWNSMHGGGWEIFLEWIPSSYSVPEEMIVKLNRVVNTKMAITLNEINNSSKNQIRLNFKQIKNEKISTISGLKKVLTELSQF